MGNGCCKVESEFNPDGSPKEPQTKEQAQAGADDLELRKAAKDGDKAELERLLRRMPRRQIQSGARKNEGEEADYGNTALHFAASRGDRACLELLVLYGSAVNGRNGAGATPLHLALEGGRRAAAHFLLEHGADINAQDKSGVSPFHAVLSSGRKRLALWLLQRCGNELDVAAVDKDGVGPCTVAARHGWWDVLDKMVGLAADPAQALNTRSADGQTPLGWLLKHGAAGLLAGEALVSAATKLMDKGASAVVPCFKEQIPPVCLAAASGHSGLVAALKARGAVLEPLAASDSVKRNALHYAAAKGHSDLCVELMGQGLLPYTRDAGGNTPLHLAASRGHGGAARALLEKSDDPVKAIMTPNGEGVTVYHLMLRAGPDERSQEGVLWILGRIGQEEAKTPIKAKEAVVDTPLLMAVGSHQDRVVAKLLEQGHDPMQANRDGDTPLSRCLASATAATAEADGAIFKLLVDKGAGVEGGSSECHPLLAVCKTPLSRFSESAMSVLLGRGGGDAAALGWAELHDAQGRTPLHLAALHDNAYMTRFLLEQAKLDIESRTPDGVTPLMCAARGCSPNAMKILLNRHADPRATDAAGRTALSYCLQLDVLPSLTCAAMLLLMGAPPANCTDLRGEGLLHRAVRYGCSEFIRLWVRYGGDVCLLATTDDTADDVPEQLAALEGGAAGAKGGAGAKGAGGAKGDYLDDVPEVVEVEEEAEEGAWDVGSGRMEAEGEEAVREEHEAGDCRPGARGGSGRVGTGSGAWGEEARDVVGQGRPGLGRVPSSQVRVGGGSSNGRGTLSQQGSLAAGRVSGSGAGAVPLVAGGVGEGSLMDRQGSRRAALERLASGGGSRGGSRGQQGLVVQGEEEFALPGGMGGGSGRAVAESVEAVEVEISRFPSFCSAPSFVEVRTWARRGPAWFDDCLPQADQSLGPDYAPPALPLPPGEDEDEEEEARVAAEEAARGWGEEGGEDGVHPALDADAILRRMLLQGMRDRRSGKRPLSGAAGGGAAVGVEGGKGAVAAERSGSGSLRRRLSAAGARVSNSGGGGGGSPGRGSPVPAAELGRRGSSSGSARPPRPASASPVASPFAAGGGAAAGSMAAGAAGSPAARVSASGGPVSEAESWLDEVHRSAESAIALLTRGSVVGRDAETAGGSGSRAVRSVLRARRSGGAGGAGVGARGPGPVAESREGGDGSSSDGSGVSSDDSDSDGGEEQGKSLDDLKDSAMGLVSKMLDKKIAITDPYYIKGTRYKGVPRYMDETKVHVSPAPPSELLALADSLADRLSAYPPPQDEQPLTGADLRERNIKWYNLGLSPGEYPLKLGQWKAAAKKARAAQAAARTRAYVGPGGKIVVRSRKAFFGLPAMPSRPELRGSSALLYAVRLCRPACVAALLASSAQHLNLPDGWGHTPVAYAAYMLARDKHNVQLQQVYDMLLERLPQVNTTYLDQADGTKGHTPLCPVNLAVITNDRARLAHLVLRCAGAINNSWTALPDIPTYLSGTWERAVAKCDSRVPPLALAVLSKRIDNVKLVLDLGANPNIFGEARDVRLKAKAAKEWAEEQELSRRLASEYNGVLVKTKLGLMQKLAKIKRAIASIDIPGLTKPHAFVTPLHLAGRTGQAEVVFLLLRRGALANGGGAVPYAKKSPLQEALLYARSNFSVAHSGARRKNWKEVRPALDDIPPMSPAAIQKEADSKASAVLRAMVDPTVVALKAVAMAAKFAVNFLMEMRKRPIAHWDPALAAAHVLLSHRAPYELADTQTSIVLRDVMDNGKWRWLKRPTGIRFKVKDPNWTSGARDEIDKIKADGEVGYARMRDTADPKEYRSLKQQFLSKSDEAYFGSGGKALHKRYSKCSAALLEAQRAFVESSLQPAIMGMAEMAVTEHVRGVSARLEAMAAARRAELEGAAAVLAGAPTLDERDVMDPQPVKAFALPAALSGGGGPSSAHTAAAEELRAAAAGTVAAEGWQRVMVWGSGGAFLGVAADGAISMPSGAEELRALAKELASVDTDELQESLTNLKECLTEGAEALLSKLQEAQQGLASLLEVIGIDFLDML